MPPLRLLIALVAVVVGLLGFNPAGAEIVVGARAAPGSGPPVRTGGGDVLASGIDARARAAHGLAPARLAADTPGLVWRPRAEAPPLTAAVRRPLAADSLLLRALVPVWAPAGLSLRAAESRVNVGMDWSEERLREALLAQRDSLWTATALAMLGGAAGPRAGSNLPSRAEAVPSAADFAASGADTLSDTGSAAALSGTQPPGAGSPVSGSDTRADAGALPGSGTIPGSGPAAAGARATASDLATASDPATASDARQGTLDPLARGIGVLSPDQVVAAGAGLGGAPGEGALSLGRYGDLSMEIRGRTDLGGAWRRAYPCSLTLPERCDPGLAPQVRPDMLLSAVIRGTLLDRVHVDVDYDAAREFDVSNQVRVSYQGAAGEALRRVEVGQVALSLPASRILGTGISAGAWGARAELGRGPLTVEALWAQQGGERSAREFRHALGGGGMAEEHEVAWDDSDYAAGQFFFLVPPSELRGHPHLDVLTLDAGDASPALAPRGAVQLWRYTGEGPRQDGSTLVLRAAPADPARAAEAVSGPFRLLEEGVDYLLHRSGTWVALRTPLRGDEALGVAYQARSGAAVGDLLDASGGSPPREIRLLKGARETHRPGSSTWELEMRQVYRVSGSDAVDRESVRLTLSRGEASGGDLYRPHPHTGEPVPYLQLLGLDADAPLDELDRDRLFAPGDQAVGGGLGGVFLVFPTLRPFAEPAAVPARGLGAAEARDALGEAANPALYEAADERDRRASSRFRLLLRYSGSGGAVGSSLSLGAVGIRDGSERIRLGERLLERGVDYDIQYETGQVQLKGDGLRLAGAPGAELRATFEQRPAFGVPTTSLFGASARYDLGPRGELRLFGVSQRERAFDRRSVLGAEPDGALAGGASGTVALQAGWLDRWVRAVAPGAAGDGSSVHLTGELALTLPDGGSRAAYLDDFEDGGGIELPLLRQAWHLGSAPADGSGLDHVLAGGLSGAAPAPLTWQHDFRDARGGVGGPLHARAIDTQLRVAGRTLDPEVLYLSLDPGGRPGWRSITTVLSPTGRDLREQEYLELYLRGGAPGDALVLDLGTVSEDALATDAEGRTGGRDADGGAWGEGVLDREWDPATESWSPSRSDRGLWAADCRATPGETYPLHDPRASCTRGNGLADTEDLDGNGVLDTAERVLRHVVRLGDPADPALARDTAETGTPFRLYRFPLRRALPAGASPHGALPDDLRAVRHLRVTVIGSRRTELAIARMRIVGSRWERRGETGIASGLAGEDALPPSGGSVEIETVSRLSDGDYLSPPGIVEEPREPNARYGSRGGVEYNERSLRIRYSDLEAGDRAEVYRRYDDAPRNFLPYRELRLWALARSGEWGREDAQLLLRVGSDAENAYLYRHAPSRVGAPRTAGDWGPEIVVELDRWMRLRADAERLLLERAPGERGPLVLWDADSTHAVVISERGRAPNLAAVRELTLGVWNGGERSSGELWVNELRLVGAARSAGGAGELAVGIRGGRLLRADLSVAGRGAEFAPFGALPGYRDDRSLALDATLETGELLPSRWGLRAPLRASIARSGSAPVFLERSDVLAEALGAARTPGEAATRLHLEISRDTASGGALGRLLLDPLRLDLSLSAGDRVGAFQAQRGTDLGARLQYRLAPAPRAFLLHPSVAEALPAVLRRLPVLSSLTGGGIRWTPVGISLASSWVDSHSETRRFSSVVAPDSSAPWQARVRRRLAQDASVSFQPTEAVRLGLGARTERDLAAGGGPAAVAGIGPGREIGRSVSADAGWRPRAVAGITPEARLTHSFAMDRDPFYVGPHQDSSATLLGSLHARRDLRTGVRLEPVALARALGLVPPADTAAGTDAAADTAADTGDDTADDTAAEAGTGRVARGGAGRGRGAPALTAALGRWRGVELGWGRAVESRFDRTGADAGLGYQLGLAGRGGFLSLGEDSAAAFADRTRVSARTTVALPFSLGVELGFEESAGEVLLRTTRDEREREWPRLSVQWSAAAPPLLRSLDVTLGYTRRERTLEDRLTAQRSAEAESALPVTATAAWPGGVATSYRVELRRGTRETPYAETARTGADHLFVVGGAVPVPRSLSAHLASPLALSLRYARSDRRECRLSDEVRVCVPGAEFSGFGDDSFRFQVDSRAGTFDLGMQVEYRERRSHVGERAGSRDLLVGIFGQFTLSAGTTP